MTNLRYLSTDFSADGYMGNYGWMPFEDGFHTCDNHEPYVDWKENDAHDIVVGEGNTHAIVTSDGMFCSQWCAEKAREETLYKAALDDRDSWYWDGIKYGEKV